MASINTFGRVEDALHLADRGFRILPVHSIVNGACTCELGTTCDKPGKHACIRAWQKKATTDKRQIEKWWRVWPSANIGILCGDDLVVIDVDGARGAKTLRDALAGREWPKTLQARTGRLEGGLHAYFRVPEGMEVQSSAAGGIEVQYTGKYVIAPPSIHRSGKLYEWIKDAEGFESPMSAIPKWLVEALDARPREGRAKRPGASTKNVPDHLRELALPRLAERAAIGMNDVPFEDLMAAAETLPNEGLEWAAYTRFCMAFWRASNGSAEGFEACTFWSKKCPAKHDQKEKLADRWAHYHKSPPDSIGFGAIVFTIRETEPDWEPPSRRPKQEEKERVDPETERAADPADQTETNGVHFPFEEDSDPKALIALNDLNKRYSVIGDIGGKCLVLSWVPSKVEAANREVKIPSFQSFKSFSERFANKYIKITRKAPDGSESEKFEQLGGYWLKWRRRKTFEGIDLSPDPGELPPGYLNMWHGFAVEPACGGWSLMRRHIIEILARGDRESAEYIFRFAAWAVQHPGERAEVALVFRGGKGTGKGTFANALRRLFGAHGLQIFNSKHLVGAFNGHLRNCLLLFSDEAFWAGDKQGESTLKGLITEPALIIEQKGIDAVPWRNRLKVIMSANNEWVVPASHDERRYTVFDVSDARKRDYQYFIDLYAEINSGGLAAMLYDLQRVDLGAWHPRFIVRTDALREQKARSLRPLDVWWEQLLQEGRLPFQGAIGQAQAESILDHFRKTMGRSAEVSAQGLASYLKRAGCDREHTRWGTLWTFPTLKIARIAWEEKLGGWKWEIESDVWLDPSTLEDKNTAQPSQPSQSVT